MEGWAACGGGLRYANAMDWHQIQAEREAYLQTLVIASIICGTITALIASNRGGTGWLWFVVGCVLGVFALPLPFFFVRNARG